MQANMKTVVSMNSFLGLLKLQTFYLHVITRQQCPSFLLLPGDLSVVSEGRAVHR